jgi:hypothetical protein
MDGLQAALEAQGVRVHLIGGADKAAELDAKRAIWQGTELALRMDPTAAAPAQATPGATHQAPPAVQASLAAWHAMVAAGDLSNLPDILHKKAVFRSPMAHTPYPGAQAVQVILGTVLKVEPVRENMVDFKNAGDRYLVTLRSAPAKVVKPGDPLWYGPFPSGFDLASGNFAPPPASLTFDVESPPRDLPPAILVVSSDPKVGQLTIGQISGSTTAVKVSRPPREGDHIFLAPTKAHPVAILASSLLPNFQHFWLLDAVTQNQPIPPGHALLILLYSGCLIGAALAVAILLFQGRDVG